MVQVERLNYSVNEINNSLRKVETSLSNPYAYIHARRPIVGFILDGDYEYNATFEKMFYDQGMNIGFAPSYTTNFSNNTLKTYLEWQEKGHEILVHSAKVLGEVNDFTDEEAVEFLKQGYKTFVDYGFDVHGLIGSHGAIAERYLPTIRSLYDYASTKGNHSAAYTGAGAESCLFFNMDNPYKLWRYSMTNITLDQMKAAVNRAIAENGLLLFYDHAQSEYWNADSISNRLAPLIEYVKSTGVTVKTPYEAIKDYYSIRYDDIVINN